MQCHLASLFPISLPSFCSEVSLHKISQDRVIEYVSHKQTYIDKIKPGFFRTNFCQMPTYSHNSYTLSRSLLILYTLFRPLRGVPTANQHETITFYAEESIEGSNLMEMGPKLIVILFLVLLGGVFAGKLLRYFPIPEYFSFFNHELSSALFQV